LRKAIKAALTSSARLAETAQVGFAEPIRQRPDGAVIAEKSLAVFDEQRGGWIGKSAPENSPHRRIDIALELAFALFQQKYLDPVGVGKAPLFRLVSRILLRICPTR